MPNGPGNFVDAGSVSMDDGNVAFFGSTVGQSGIYTDFGGTLQVVADTTMPMPDGPGNFANIDLPSLSNGNIAFWGSARPWG